MSDLTPKQARFVEEYLVDLNGKQAAIRAGYAAGTAESEASRLLRNVKVSVAVAKALQARSEKTGIDAAWVLTRLAEEVSADIADILDADGNYLPVRQWPKIWRTGLVAGFKVETNTVDGKPVVTVAEVKVSDRIKRLELIGKHVNVQAFREQIGHGNPDGTPLAPEKDGRELAREIAFALAAGLQEVKK